MGNGNLEEFMEFGEFGLIGGFKIRKNKIGIDIFKRNFELFNFEKKLFEEDPDKLIADLIDDMTFLNFNKKFEIFCNDYNLDTIGIYVSKTNFGELIIEMETSKMNLVIMDIILMFLTNHFGFKFSSEESK